MKILKRFGAVLVLLLIVIQIYRPPRTNPWTDETRTIFTNSQMTADVKAIFERSCNDCHSNNTVWPWYSNVAPISWFVIDHVNDARKELSFSEWGTYSVKKADHKLEKICEEVGKGKMPLKSYLILHRDAALTGADTAAICNWVNQERTRIEANRTQ